MIKIHCDGCKNETKDPNFLFQAQVREIKHSLTDPRPQLVERQIHLCKKCFDKSLGSLLK